LVITDLEMPRLDGFELTRRIRSSADLSRLPVVMLTSLAGEEEIERGRKAGATAYCIKLDRDQLLSIAAEVLARRPATEPAEGRSELEHLARHLREEADPARTMAMADKGETV
jgi:CheY-like chemotaxis protein